MPIYRTATPKYDEIVGRHSEDKNASLMEELEYSFPNPINLLAQLTIFTEAVEEVDSVVEAIAAQPPRVAEDFERACYLAMMALSQILVTAFPDAAEVVMQRGAADIYIESLMQRMKEDKAFQQ